jgi:hypothetical protein
MSTARSRLITAAAAALLVASCRHGATTRTAPDARAGRPLADRSQPHWIQDQQLRTVMSELSLRTRESWPQNVPDDPEALNRPRDETFREAASLADALASAADRIPKSVEKQPMSETDRHAFASEASRLRDNALDLKAAAEQRRVEPMQRALDQVNSSCIGCHSRFRDFAGELDTRRASLDERSDPPLGENPRGLGPAPTSERCAAPMFAAAGARDSGQSR